MFQNPLLCTEPALRLTACSSDPSLSEYLSATLFISAIKDGLMLSATSAVLIC